MIRNFALAAAFALGGYGLLASAPASADVRVGVEVGPGYAPVDYRGGRYYGERRYGYRPYRAPVRVYVAPPPPRRYYAPPRYYRSGGDGCETVKVRVWNGYGYETHKRQRCY